MPARVIRAVEMRDFSFNDTAGGATALIIAAQHIDVTWAREVTMAVRWHKGTIGTGASVLVGAIPDGYTSDDPAAHFGAFGEPTGNGSGSITITDSDETPFYITRKLASLSGDLPTGAMLTIIVAGTQPATPVGCDPTLSVDLVLRD